GLLYHLAYTIQPLALPPLMSISAKGLLAKLKEFSERRSPCSGRFVFGCIGAAGRCSSSGVLSRCVPSACSRGFLARLFRGKGLSMTVIPFPINFGAESGCA